MLEIVYHYSYIIKTNCGTDHTANRSIAYHTDLTQQAGFLLWGHSFSGYLPRTGTVASSLDDWQISRGAVVFRSSLVI